MPISEKASAAEAPTRAVPRAAAVYLAVIQFLFATTWIIYVVYLPKLVESVGVRPELVIWILLLDQAVFVVMDFVMGVAADRVLRATGRLAPPILAASAASCLAFLLMPQLAGLRTANG